MSGDLPESGRVDVGARIGKVGVIQGVVGFGAELDGVFVGPWHQEALGEHIEVHEAGSAEIISVPICPPKGFARAALAAARSANN